MHLTDRVASIAAEFSLAGEVASIERVEGGHIHDSYRVVVRSRDTQASYLLQRINTQVFPDPEKVIRNIERVTGHFSGRDRTAPGPPTTDRSETLTLVPALNGALWHRNPRGEWWRMFVYIEGADVFHAVATPRQAEAGGRAFGAFHARLIDLPSPRLLETIPHFHDTPRRFEQLDAAVAMDPKGRLAEVQEELEFVLHRRRLAPVLVDLHRQGKIPERVIHNDAKMSNVLMDRITGHPLCVVDLDTVMPGLVLFDFGDMVRSMTCRAAEDELDLSRVKADMELFEGLARGYLAATDSFLTDTEREHLVLAGRLITLEQGVRFLADYLMGDGYYRTARPRHNLDRCRTQLQLLRSLEAHEAEMVHIIEDISRPTRSP